MKTNVLPLPFRVYTFGLSSSRFREETRRKRSTYLKKTHNLLYYVHFTERVLSLVCSTLTVLEVFTGIEKKISLKSV